MHAAGSFVGVLFVSIGTVIGCVLPNTMFEVQKRGIQKHFICSNTQLSCELVFMYVSHGHSNPDLKQLKP